MNDVTKIDITKIAQFSNKRSELPGLTKMSAPDFLRTMIEAIDMTTTLLSRAIHQNLKAKSALEQAESIAYLENASAYLIQQGIKDSAEARKRYVDLDVKVIAAKDEYARTEALIHFLKGRLKNFQNTHDDAKKIVYDNNGGTQWEGC